MDRIHLPASRPSEKRDLLPRSDFMMMLSSIWSFLDQRSHGKGLELAVLERNVCVSVLASWKFLTASELIQTVKSQIIIPSFNHSLLSYRPQEDQSCQMKNICLVIYNFTGSLFSCMEIFLSGLANAFKITVVLGRKNGCRTWACCFHFSSTVRLLSVIWTKYRIHSPKA